MSLITLRNDIKKQNNFISDCFNFIWLGKYEVSLHFTNTKYSVVSRNFKYFDNYTIELFPGDFFYYDFSTPIEAINHFTVICFSLISELSIENYSTYQTFFDFNRPQGWHEWLPILHKYLK